MYTNVYPKSLRVDELIPHETADAKYRWKIAEVLGIDSRDIDSFFVSAVSTDDKFVMVQFADVGEHDVPLALQDLRGMVFYNDGDDLIKVAPGSRYTKVVILDKPELPIRTTEDGKSVVDIKFVYKGDVFGETTEQDIVFDLSPGTKDKCRSYIKGTYLTHVKIGGEVYTFTAYSVDPSGKIKDSTWAERWLSEYVHYLEDQGDSADEIYYKVQNPQDYIVDSETKYKLLRRRITDRPPAPKANYAFSEPFTTIRENISDPRDFFPFNVKTSPFSYSEILSIPENSAGSKAPVPKGGFVTLVRADKNWNYGPKNPWGDKRVGAVDHGAIDPADEMASVQRAYKKAKVVNGLPLSRKDPWVTRNVTNLTLEQTNEILRYGYIPEFPNKEMRKRYLERMDVII